MEQRNNAADGTRATSWGLLRAAALLLALACGCLPAAAQTTEFVELGSVVAGTTHPANGPSERPRMSEDGRFMVFQTRTSGLVPQDANIASDVFVYDFELDKTTLVSVSVSGAAGDNDSEDAFITPDGRYVVFLSLAGDLVFNDFNNAVDVFVRDLVAQTTTLVSVNANGTGSANGGSFGGLITPDGRYVTFTSAADDLAAGAITPGPGDVYRRDLQTGTTVLVSVNAAGTAGGNNGATEPLAITPDGRYVLFTSQSNDLAANDTNGILQDVYRRDLQTNTTALASVNGSGTGTGNAAILRAAMSDDGRVVAFESTATNLVASGAGTGFPAVYAHDFSTGATTLVSEPQVLEAGVPTVPPSRHPRVSADGRYVFYLRQEMDQGVVLNRQPVRDRIFRRDLQTGELLELPFVATGICAQGFDCVSRMTWFVTSRDGRYVAYTQEERPRGSSTPFSTAIVVRDMVGGGAEVVVGKPGVPVTPAPSGNLVPGAVVTGGKLAFESGARHTPDDTNQFTDVYRFAPPPEPRFVFNRPSYTVEENGAVSLNQGEVVVRRAGYLINTTSTVRLTTSDGTATAGSDYVARAETLTFAPGEAEKTVIIQTVNDGVPEPAETLTVTLSEPTGNSTLGAPSSVTLTIADDEAPSLQFGRADYNVPESGGAVTVTVTRTGRTGDAVSVNYATSNGTAAAGSDYTAASGTLTFAAGETSKTFQVNVADDSLDEDDETVNITLSGPAGGATLGAPAAALLTIADDDATPALSVNDAAVTEGNAGTVSANFTLTLSAPSGRAVTVSVATADGTANAGPDYGGAAFPVTFFPGETSKVVTVGVFGDTFNEPDETFLVNLSGAVNAAISDGQGLGTILNDDAPALRFSQAAYNAGEGAHFVTVTVTRSGDASAPVSVNFATGDGTATERRDYTAASGALRFAAGQTQQSFDVLLTEDAFQEPDETVNLTLSDPAGGAVLGAQATAVVVIAADDNPPPAVNPIDVSSDFVRQHYHDFLNREPDANGFQFWTNEIESCGANAQCREVKRIHVSAAFFLSIEFQTTGYLAYLTQRAAHGSRLPYTQFMFDVQALQKGFAFGQPGANAQLEANKRAYFEQFVARDAFVSKYGALSNKGYVDALLLSANLAPTVGNIFVSRLVGAQAVPPNPSAAVGRFILIRDPGAADPTVSVSLQLDNLSGPVTAVHIHGPAGAGGTAPVLRTLTAGEFADLQLTLTQQETNLLNGGQLYVDVHTQNSPDGEIRAQLGPARFREDVLAGALDNGTLTRAQVLRIVAESPELRRAEFNKAFVLMEYFGYLRRDPDQEGYDFWLNKLNAFGGDYIRAEMVKAFISSAEYRQRFGPQ